MAMWLTTAVWLGSRISLVSWGGDMRPFLPGVSAGEPGCESTMKAPSTLMRTAPGCMMVLSISSAATATTPCLPSSAGPSTTAALGAASTETSGGSGEPTAASLGAGVVVGGITGRVAHSIREARDREAHGAEVEWFSAVKSDASSDRRVCASRKV